MNARSHFLFIRRGQIPLAFERLHRRGDSGGPQTPNPAPVGGPGSFITGFGAHKDQKSDKFRNFDLRNTYSNFESTTPYNQWLEIDNSLNRLPARDRFNLQGGVQAARRLSTKSVRG
jgi:hypothetical protein